MSDVLYIVMSANIVVRLDTESHYPYISGFTYMGNHAQSHVRAMNIIT